MIEDAELLRRYAETRSEEAFAELVRRRIGLVYSVALRTTHDPQRAEDVTQTVFADLARKAASLADRPVLAGWLYRSAHYAALGVVRAERNRAAREQEAHTMQEIIGSENSAAEWEKVRPVLDDVMSELSEPDRDAIVLRFFDGRPFADVGARLKLTENSARMRVERALDKLHALLARRGIRSTPAALGVVLAHQATAAFAPAGLAATVTGSALASAKAVAAPAISFLQLMSTSKTAAAAAGIILTLALGTAVYEVHAGREVAAALAAASRENTASLARLREAQQRATAAGLAGADLQKSYDVARAARDAEQQRTAAASKSAVAQMAATRDFGNRHPEVKRAVTDRARAQAAKDYAPLFRTLHLTAEQIEAFKDVMAAGLMSYVNSPSGERIAVATDGDSRSKQPRLRELLGEDAFRAFQEFQTAKPAWALAANLASMLYYSATPLTLDQATGLVRVLTENRAPAADGRAPGGFAWEAVASKVGAVLSPPQIAALDALKSQDQFQNAIGTAMMNATGRGAPPPATGK